MYYIVCLEIVIGEYTKSRECFVKAESEKAAGLVAIMAEAHEADEANDLVLDEYDGCYDCAGQFYYKPWSFKLVSETDVPVISKYLKLQE